MLKKVVTLAILSLFLTNFTIPTTKAAGTFPVDQFPYKEMQIQVMPEFDYPDNWPKDQPSLLVGYYGKFENKTGQDYSGEIEFPVPVTDKNFEVYLVAEFPSDNDPEVQRPFEVDKEKSVLTWKPEKAIKKGETYSFVVEYYTNPYKSGSKEFIFDYTNPVDVEKLDIVMYQPLNSKDFKVEPKATSTSESEYGAELHLFQYTSVKKGNNVKLSVSYDKKDNESTLSLINKQTPPKDENHPGDTATDQVLNNADNDGKASKRPIISTGGAAVIGVSIIIAGIFIFLGLKGNTNKSKPTGQKNKKVPNKPINQKPNKQDLTEQKKKLRTLLINGKIDEKTYELEIQKLG